MADVDRYYDYMLPPRADVQKSSSAARKKRGVLDVIGGAISDIPNMLNGTGIPERLALANEFLNPVSGIYDAMGSSEDIFAPNRTGYERAASVGDMLSNIAGAAIPLASGARGGVNAVNAATEMLTGAPVRYATDAADLAARSTLGNIRAIGEGDFDFLRAGGTPQSLSAGILAKQADPAAVRGAEIVDLLRSGRSDDVTEEMLDMGDPVLNANLNQYLYRNYDLPMDEASRMQRAAEGGFTPVLHGTGADINAIDPNKLGEKQDVLGRGFYTTTSPNRADTYAPSTMVDGEKVYREGANIMPLMVKETGLLDLTKPTGEDLTNKISNAFRDIGFDVEVRGNGDTAFIKNPKDIKQSVMIDSYQTGQTTLARLRDAFGKKNLTGIFSEADYSGLKGAEGGGRSVRVNYNPEDVRAKSARFDPRLSHLKNLSAAAAGTGLLGAGMQDRNADRGY